MTCSVLVVGMPSPAGCASTKTWKAAASLVEQRLSARFGPAVVFEYAELFGPDMAHHSDVEEEIGAGGAVPPVKRRIPSMTTIGGKLNISAIERAVEGILEPDRVHA